MLEELEDVLSYFETEEEIKIELKSYDYLCQNINYFKTLGFEFLGVDKKNIFKLKKDNLNVLISILNEIPFKDIMMPDYSKSMVNLTSSILKSYGKKSNYPSFKQLDDILKKKYKHVLFLILDGLGYNIIKNSFNQGDFLLDNLYTSLSAVYPSTTACAIPTSASAKLSLETGWLGWENYIKEVNKNVILFTGCDYKTGENLGINVRKQYLPYDDYFASLGIPYYDLEPSFKPNGYETLDKMLKAFLTIQNKDEANFTYAYWAEPDSTFHEYGVYSNQSQDMLKRINQGLDKYLSNINEDTLVIITADHGHQDVYPIKLYLFTDLMEMLERMPANEGRCLCFKVKEEYINEFPKLFNSYFGNIYNLYKKSDFIEKGFLGDSKKYGINSRLNDFLSDYIAVGKSSYYFEYVPNDFIFKSAHAGLTEDEMLTPLIIYSKK